MKTNKYSTYKNKLFINLIWLLLIIYTIIYSYRTLQWILCPVANEAFEWGTIKMLHCFLEGINPYTFDNFLGNAYVFGPFFPWLCSILYSILGFESDPIIFCRFLSLLFITSASFLISNIVYNYTNRDKLLSYITFLCMLVAAFQTAPITAFPPSLAILFYAYTAWSLHQLWGNKLWNIVVISLLTILCFYIKQYFIMLIAVVWLYFLVSKQWKSLIYYSIFTVSFGVLSIVFLQIYAPTCLYIMVATHAHVAGYNLIHLLKQWGGYIVFYSPLFLSITYCIYTRKKIPLFFLVFFVISSICVTMVGGHTGASYEYFHHLLLLPLVTLGFICYKQLPLRFYNVGMLLVIFCSVFHIKFIQCCPSIQKDKLNVCMNKLKKYENDDLSNSYNLALVIDDWGYKQGMSRLIFDHTRHILSIYSEIEVPFFNKTHLLAKQKMQFFLEQLNNDIMNGNADYIFSIEKNNYLEKIDNHPYVPIDTIIVPQGRKSIQKVIIYKSVQN